MSLELTPEQRTPGLKNPLTQEQIAWLTKDEATVPFVMGDPQEVAEWVLTKNPDATLGQIMGALYG